MLLGVVVRGERAAALWLVARLWLLRRQMLSDVLAPRPCWWCVRGAVRGAEDSCMILLATPAARSQPGPRQRARYATAVTVVAAAGVVVVLA